MIYFKKDRYNLFIFLFLSPPPRILILDLDPHEEKWGPGSE